MVSHQERKVSCFWQPCVGNGRYLETLLFLMESLRGCFLHCYESIGRLISPRIQERSSDTAHSCSHWAGTCQGRLPDLMRTAPAQRGGSIYLPTWTAWLTVYKATHPRGVKRRLFEICLCDQQRLHKGKSGLSFTRFI